MRWILLFLAVMSAAGEQKQATVTVDQVSYSVEWMVRPMPCDDLHPDGCHRRAVGVPRPEIASVAVWKLLENVRLRLGPPFEVDCKGRCEGKEAPAAWVKRALQLSTVPAVRK